MIRHSLFRFAKGPARHLGHSVRAGNIHGNAHHHHHWRNLTRNIWTAKTTVSVEAETLLEELPDLKSDAESSTAVLFNISRNTPPEILSTLVKTFQDLPFPAIGCLSHGHDGSNPPYMLSYAIHKASDTVLEMVVPFRSDIPGTPKIALGREVSQLEKNVHSTEWAGNSAAVPEALPEELRKLRPGLISHLFYFTDDQPQGLMKTLDYRLPNTTRLGSIAAATPFATGRPRTLISSSNIHSEGAVGIAFCRSPNPYTGSSSAVIDYGKLSTLGQSLEVTSCKGNIILELGSENATRKLLERIQQNVDHRITKESGFYLGLLPDGQNEATLDQMESVRPIEAGDPSRGALSVDTEANIRVGQRVQFLHTPARARDEIRLSDLQDVVQGEEAAAQTSPLMVFRCDEDGDMLERTLRGAKTFRCSSFFVPSDGGFVLGQPRKASWICQVDGSQAKLSREL